jgi:hypothetical protein
VTPLSVLIGLTAIPRGAIRGIAELAAVPGHLKSLPEVAERLAAIQARVESLDDEVILMRQGVDSLGTDVVGLRETVKPLEGRIGRIAGFLPRARGPAAPPPAERP